MIAGFQSNNGKDFGARCRNKECNIRHIRCHTSNAEGGKFDKNLSSELKKEYDDYIGIVQIFKEQIERKHCPIVVAGRIYINNSC